MLSKFDQGFDIRLVIEVAILTVIAQAEKV